MFDAGELWATLYLNRDPFTRGLEEAMAEAKAFEEDGVTVPVRLDAGAFDAGQAAVSVQKDAMSSPVSTSVSMDAGAFDAGAAAVAATKRAMADPVFVTVEFEGKYDSLLTQLFAAGVAPGEASDALASMGEKAKDARGYVSDYMQRFGMQTAPERQAVADSIVEAVLPSVDQIKTAVEDTLYSYSFGQLVADALYREFGNGRLEGFQREASVAFGPDGFQLALMSAAARAATGPEGQLALPAAGQTWSSGATDAAWAAIQRDIGSAVRFSQNTSASGDIGTQLLFGLPHIGGALGALDPLNAGAGGRGGGGVLGTAANFADGRFLQFLGVPAAGAGALALSLPVIVSLGSALFTAAAGMLALGVAAAPTFAHIASGYSAVNQANDAIQQAVPGTQAWVSAIQGVSAAWTSVDMAANNGAIRSAVADIQGLFSGNNPVMMQAQGWLVNQIGNVTGFIGGHGGHIFEPLIVSTENAVSGLIAGAEHAMGSTHFANFILGLSHDVGPAIRGLASIGLNIAHFIGGLAHAAGYGGEGLNLLVQLTGTLAQITHSSAFTGFVQGFITVDRTVLSIISGIFRIGSAIDRYLHIPMASTLGVALGAYMAMDRLVKLGGAIAGSTAVSNGGIRALLGGGEAAAGGAGGGILPWIGRAIVPDAALSSDAAAAGFGTIAMAALPLLAPVLAYQFNSESAFQRYQAQQLYAQNPGMNARQIEAMGISQMGQHTGLAPQPGASTGYLSSAGPLETLLGTSVWAPGDLAKMAMATHVQGAMTDQAAAAYRILPAAWRSQAGNYATMLSQSFAAIVNQAYNTQSQAVPPPDFTQIPAQHAQFIGSMLAGLTSRNQTALGWENNYLNLMHHYGTSIDVPQITGFNKQGVALGSTLNPIATIAASAPQDLASIIDALHSSDPKVRGAVHQLFQAMTEQILIGNIAAMAAAGKGVTQLTAYIGTLLTSGTPGVRQAAMAVAHALNIPIPTILSHWQMALNQLSAMFGGTAAQIRSLMASSAGVTALHGGFYGGHRATGGPVSPMMAYLVGERGPELFVPGQSGTIVPNSALNSTGGVRGANFTVNLYIDASGSSSQISATGGANALAKQVIPIIRQSLRSAVATVAPVSH